MITDNFKVQEGLGVLFTFQDLVKIRLKGNSLEHFINTWDTFLAGQATPVPDNILEHVFLEQVQDCAELKEDVAHYWRAEVETAGGPPTDRSYKYLYNACLRVIARNKFAANRAAIANAHEQGAFGM